MRTRENPITQPQTAQSPVVATTGVGAQKPSFGVPAPAQFRAIHSAAQRGRRSKLSAESYKAIVDAVGQGTPYNHACALAGVTERTFHNWMNEGRRVADQMEELAEMGHPEEDILMLESNVFFQFFRAVKKAEAEAVQRMSLVVQVAAKTEWTAAAWYLERRCPEVYGRKDKIEHTGRVESANLNVNVDVNSMREDIPDASLLRILNAVVGRNVA